MALASPTPEPAPPWPVVVAGLGGSGTRLLVALLRFAGVQMGTKVNATEDALAFRRFNQTWIRPFLQHRRGQLPELDFALMAEDLRRTLDDHCADFSDPARPWGWKRPESIHLLPFLHQQLPGLTFLHLIRNGLDMAFSTNQNDLRRYGDIALSRAHEHEPEPLRSQRLWALANTAVADYGESHLGARYLRIPYELLCSRPEETISTLFRSLGLPADPAAAARLVTAPQTIGRWRTQSDLHLLVRLLQAGEPALRRFGYWDDAAYRQLTARVGPWRLTLLPVENLARRVRHLLARAARAARERRLRAAVRNQWARWIR